MSEMARALVTAGLGIWNAQSEEEMAFAMQEMEYELQNPHADEPTIMTEKRESDGFIPPSYDKGGSMPKKTYKPQNGLTGEQVRQKRERERKQARKRQKNARKQGRRK